MDQLAAEQYQCGETIQKLFTNYKKDGAARKTFDYLNRRLENLEAEWATFNERHHQIQELCGEDQSHPYFIKAFPEQVEKIYKEFYQTLKLSLDSMTTSTKHQGTSITPSETVQIERLIRQQKAAMIALKSLLQEVETALQHRQSQAYYNQKLISIREYWKNISAIHLQIAAEPEQLDYQAEFYLEMERYVQRILINVQEKIDQNSNSPSTITVNNSMKLPKITLPVFDGNYLHWKEFHDLYLQLIHQQHSLSTSEKMFYLKAHLSGEAAKLIQHLQVSEINYASAWKILEGRYNNKRLLVSALLSKFLGQPVISTESAVAIKRLHDVTKECMSGITNLGISIGEWDPIVLHLLLQKLDKETHRLYEQSLESPKELQTLTNLLLFLENRFQTLEALGGARDRTELKRPAMYKTSLTTSKIINKCPICQSGNHLIYSCAKFLQLSPAERLKRVRNLQRCVNCLKPGHSVQNCSSQHCTKCDAFHNTLLHMDQKLKSTKVVSVQSRPNSTHQITCNNNASLSALDVHNNLMNYVFLGTANLDILDLQNKPVKARALLDSGSQVNFISERLSKKLKYATRTENLSILGIGSTQLKLCKKINIAIQSKVTGYVTRLEAFIIPQITSCQPTKHINIKDWPIPQNIPLADENFNTPQDIDLLIGAELYPELLSIGQIKLGKTLPTIQNTVLGWIIMGKAEGISHPYKLCGINSYSDELLEEQLQRFWTIEEVPTPENTPVTSTSNQQCEEFFKSTTKRTANGRYVVGLPFAQDSTELGSSKDIAIRRFLNLERKLNKTPELKIQYINFMREYAQLGHMSELKELPTGIPHYFLPHHCVLRPESSTTKLRVVFDGSAKTSTNRSLNDILHKGPALQNDLLSILIRFRIHRYVFTCDITKMYRQIMIDNCDKRFQLIIWRENSDEPLKYYQLNTLTYGTKPAPYLAIRCLHDLAEIGSNKYPLGATVTKRDFYVDDLLTGSNDLQQAIQIRNQVINLLDAGGFKLRKWCSNTPAVLKGIPKEDRVAESIIGDRNESQVKTLGLTWLPGSDQFIIKPVLEDSKRVTKRTILADIAHIFDPLGLINPVIILAKIFMQELWALKINWDASLPAELHTKWLKFRTDLKKLDQMQIPRHIIVNLAQDVQIHAFSDASERAYGSAVYLRSTNNDGSVRTHLICSKSRVAPMKVVSIPRLELCAAKLMVQLTEAVQASLPIKINDTFYWTDSQIVLAWLRTQSPLQTFVANRVSYIQEKTNLDQWRFVNTEQNPADIISRGIFPEQFLKNTMWFCGPKFLQLIKQDWPNETSYIKQNELIEVKVIKTVLTGTKHEPHLLADINHRNSFRTLQNVTAYILRFVHNLRVPLEQRKLSKTLSPRELEEALQMIIKYTQESSFKEEINSLQKSNHVKSDSRLSSLAPFIDSRGVLRVRGRIEESNLPYDAKHQMILPGANTITKLLMTQLHIDHLHVGPQGLISITRQRFWPLRGKRLSQTIVNQCIRCFRAKPRGAQQLMGNLPPERVQPARPFVNVGVDFFGPLNIHYKLRGKRPSKAYVAVFICFATKATHFEVVTDLTSAAFIGALKRFIARRGHPSKIFCDNASNFTGAKNELQELSTMFLNPENQTHISGYCAQKQIEWKPIPARSPHVGGLWEAAVKSAKYHMKRVLANVSLTHEELTTVTTQIEAILNSRPITPLSTDPNDLQALTPGHFLIGEPLTTLADNNAKERQINSVARWNLVKSYHQEFWRRWSQEYLQELQNRYKWKYSKTDIQPDTLVLLKEDNLPPLQWRLGRVLRTIPGADGHTRVLDIKTSTGETTRSIHRVCPLPTESNEEENAHQRDEEENAHQTAELHEIKFKSSKVGSRHPLKGRFLPIQNPTISQTRCHKRSASENSKEKQKGSKVIRTTSAARSLLSTIIVLICAGTGLCDSPPPVEVIHFKNKPGIYFEDLGQAKMVNNEWNIIAYYNMSNYWQEYNGILECVNRIKLEIPSLRSEGKLLRVAILQQLQQNWQDIKQLNEILTHRSGLRSKRSPFDIMGTIANKLFGVLDQEYATQMEETITKVHQNEAHLLNLIRNQTSIIDATVNVMNKSYSDIKKQFEIFDQHLLQVHDAVKTLNQLLTESHKVQTFTSLIIYTSLMITNFQRTQLAIMEVLTDSHRGKLNPFLLSPKQLQKTLTDIRKNLNPTLIIPGHDEHDLLLLYELLRVTARVTPSNIIFNIKLPLLSNEIFQIFKIIPLPTRHNNSFQFIEPSTPFLAVNPFRDRYFPLSQQEIKECLTIEEGKYICKQRHPIFNSHSTEHHCEVQLLNHKETLSEHCKLRQTTSGNIWVQLHNPNNWIFAFDQEYTFNIICGSSVITKRIVGEGLLKLEANCAIRQSTLTITAHNFYSSNLALSFVPATNLSQILNNTLRTIQTSAYQSSMIIRGEEDTSSLSKAIQDIKHQQLLPENTSAHDIHHYSLGYATFTGLIIITIIIVYKWYIIRYKTTPQPSFELKDLKAGENV